MYESVDKIFGTALWRISIDEYFYFTILGKILELSTLSNLDPNMSYILGSIMLTKV